MGGRAGAKVKYTCLKTSVKLTKAYLLCALPKWTARESRPHSAPAKITFACRAGGRRPKLVENRSLKKKKTFSLSKRTEADGNKKKGFPYNYTHCTLLWCTRRSGIYLCEYFRLYLQFLRCDQCEIVFFLILENPWLTSRFGETFLCFKYRRTPGVKPSGWAGK